jgi:hypothetical protein
MDNVSHLRAFELSSLGGAPHPNRYVVLKRLSAKNSQDTVLAQDEITRQRVVIKRFLFDDVLSESALDALQQAANRLKALSHPAIPQYLDAFVIDMSTCSGYALVQPYVEGRSLAQYLNAGCTFDEADIQRIMRAVLDVLGYLHQQQPPLLHLDLKPSNLLIRETPSESDFQVYLIDISLTPIQLLTSRATHTGTYGYRAPEHYAGQAVPASDLYSLGVLAIALATGKHPADLPQRQLRILFANMVTLSQPFIYWIKRMADPSLKYRLQSVRAARAALDHLPMPPPLRPITLMRLWLNALWRSVLGGLILGALCGVVGVLLVAPSLDITVGLATGTALGAGVGVVNSVVLALVTRIGYLPLVNVSRYRPVLAGVSVIAGAIATFLPMLQLIGTNINSSQSGWTAVAALAAGLGMGVVAQQFVQWYERANHDVQLWDDGQSTPKAP